TAASSAIRGSISRGATPHSRACSSRLRRPLSGRSTTASWKTTLLARLASIGEAATSKPPTSALPADGTTVVLSIPTVVDFPAPFGPSSPNPPPPPPSRSTPFPASTPPGYVFRSPCTEMASIQEPPLGHNDRLSYVIRVDECERKDVTGE